MNVKEIGSLLIEKDDQANLKYPHSYIVCFTYVRNKFHLVYTHNHRRLATIGATIIYV